MHISGVGKFLQVWKVVDIVANFLKERDVGGNVVTNEDDVAFGRVSIVKRCRSRFWEWVFETTGNDFGNVSLVDELTGSALLLVKSLGKAHEGSPKFKFIRASDNKLVIDVVFLLVNSEVARPDHLHPVFSLFARGQMGKVLCI
jgi:hypothetical protein